MKEKMYYLLPLLLLLALPGLVAAWRSFQAEKLQAEVEKSLPTTLIETSTLSASTSFEKLLAAGAASKTAASLLFKKCSSLISKGAPVQIAVSHSFSAPSPVVQKTGELLSKLYVNGNSVFPHLREFALEIAEYNQVKETAKADASMQKYSLLASSAFLVPVIIALIYSVSQKAGQIMSATPASTGVVLISINAYLLIFAFLSAKLLARQFSTNFLQFFSLTAPAALLVFNTALVLL